MPGNRLSLADVERFVLAGDAVFTVVRPARTAPDGSADPEVRFTYRVTRAKGNEPDRPWFVKVLTGPDNESSYSFVGTVFPDGDCGEVVYRHSWRKSRIGDEAPSVRGIAWLVERLSALRRLEAVNALGDDEEREEVGDEALPVVRSLSKVEVWHEGRCGRCGRRLTVPESIAAGIGPECAERMAGGA